MLTFTTLETQFLTDSKGLPPVCDEAHILGCTPNDRPGARPKGPAGGRFEALEESLRAREVRGPYVFGENTRARGAARVDRVRMLE